MAYPGLPRAKGGFTKPGIPGTPRAKRAAAGETAGWGAATNPQFGAARSQGGSAVPRETFPDRELAILEEIVEYYLERQESISARTLSKISRLSLSPTTIRNLMEDLSAEGLLTSSGVPRGRVPTQKALSLYVTRLTLSPGAAAQAAPAPTFAAALEQAGATLSRESGCVALCAFPPAEAYPLGWVHFGAAPGNQVLVAVRTLLDDLWCKVLDTPTPFPDDLLREVVRFINERYRAAPLARIRQDIMAGEPKELLDRMPSLGAAFRMLRKAFEWDPPPQRIWGQERLLLMPAGQDGRHLYLLQQALADPALLRRGLGTGRGVAGARVSLGTETGYAALAECALVGHPFGAAGWSGTVGVLGPMSLNYPRVLDSVVRAAQTLSSAAGMRLAVPPLPR
jgi:heat-inducible transcriptional repressor